MIYWLAFFGGPHDGETKMSPRPYDAFKFDDGSVYRADADGDDCLEWIADGERRITLHFQTNGDFP